MVTIFFCTVYTHNRSGAFVWSRVFDCSIFCLNRHRLADLVFRREVLRSGPLQTRRGADQVSGRPFFSFRTLEAVATRARFFFLRLSHPSDGS